jgi:hypothetical protein
MREGEKMEESIRGSIEITITPYREFILSTPDQLAEKLLKASCCYCAFGKDGELNCTNTEGAHCKEGILAYLQGKTLD